MFRPACAALLALTVSGVASAEEFAHTGFHLNLQAGPSYVEVDDSTNGFAGFGVQWSVSVGGAVARNLVLGGTIWSSTAFAERGSFGTVGIAPELTYFFRSNWFLSGAVGLHWISVTPSGGTTITTSPGIGGRAAVGKEWWLSGGLWGLGLALRLAVSSNQDTNGVTLITTEAALMMSVSFQ